MVRAIAMSAASALCLIWAAGCASTSDSAPKAAAATADAATKTADTTVDPHADLATLAKNLPGTLEGEIQRADLLRSKGDYADAATSYAQLLLVAPDDARVVGGYGKVLEQQGHSKEAQAFLRRAVQLNPRDWALESALGVADDQLDDHKSARAAYDRALILKPGDASVLNNYAVSLMLSGDYVGAKKMLARAEARGVSNPKVALNLDKADTLDNVSVASTAAPAKPMADTSVASPATATGKPGAVAIASLGTTSVKSPAPILLTNPAPKLAAAKTSPKASATTTNTRVATTTPKTLSTSVVMEKVPVDPLAGPTKHREHTVQRLAGTAHQPAKPAAPKTSVAAAPVAPPPALRTAADGD